jgi:DNA-binding NarL/FixJ family response regulator
VGHDRTGPRPGRGQLGDQLTAGASGFLLKDVSAAHLANAVRLVTTGDALLAPAITRRLVARYARHDAVRTATHQRLASLTPRELEILELVGRGLNNRELAERLRVREATVKTHITHILTKLSLRDRIQAVMLAYETGIVSPGTSPTGS